MDTLNQQLICHIIEFVGLLRRAGLKLGADSSLKTIESLTAVSLTRHQDFYLAIRATLISSREQHEIFDQVFNLYWQNSKLPHSALAVSLPRSKIKSSGEKSYSRRVLDAFDMMNNKSINHDIEIEAIHLSWSDSERLQKMDFESMSSDEFVNAQMLIGKLKLLFKPVASRRYRSTNQVKKIDLRRSLKSSSKYAAQLIDLKYKKKTTHNPPLVLFVDISGSMSRYAHIMLLFAHVLHKARPNVHVFLFATRLTPVSRLLIERDIDQAFEGIGNQVSDWNSGTRIGQSVKEFNKIYSRRILNSNSDVLFVSDGLDRGDNKLLDVQFARLSRSCKRLIWLNPLLRFEKYKPRAKGASTILPYVNQLLPIHNLSSLEQLIGVLQSRINLQSV